jgi:ubiquinone/menaquinone biosynthesis C-methylase UbiE
MTDRRLSRRTLLLAAALALSAGPLGTVPAPAQEAQPHGGAHQGADRHRRPEDLQRYLRDLDSPSRDEYQKPAEVIAALRLAPGMAVADLGSGSGYFTRRFAQAVGSRGLVYAVDVEPEMLAYVERSLPPPAGRAKVEIMLADPASPRLPPASVDLVFVCNVYHHLEDRAAYFARLAAALKPGGRVAIVDFHQDERSGNVGFPRRHLVARETVLAEMARAGYRPVREHGFLPRQYFLEFEPVPNAP